MCKLWYARQSSGWLIKNVQILLRRIPKFFSWVSNVASGVEKAARLADRGGGAVRPAPPRAPAERRRGRPDRRTRGGTCCRAGPRPWPRPPRAMTVSMCSWLTSPASRSRAGGRSPRPSDSSNSMTGVLPSSWPHVGDTRRGGDQTGVQPEVADLGRVVREQRGERHGCCPATEGRRRVLLLGHRLPSHHRSQTTRPNSADGVHSARCLHASRLRVRATCHSLHGLYAACGRDAAAR